MTKQEPKPGELWRVRDATEGDEFAAFCSGTTLYWIDYEGGSWRSGDEATHIRRLIVLDPESADDVERLEEAIRRSSMRACGPAVTKHILRVLAAPPEPEMPEPTALGIVVVDGNDETWVSSQWPGAIRPWVNTSNARRRSWEDIPRPVRLATDEERGA